MWGFLFALGVVVVAGAAKGLIELGVTEAMD
jgi:hypothetical protein